MKLITFIEQLVDHPDQMAQFKADPEQYVADQGPTFRRELREALNISPIEEVTTIITMSTKPRLNPADARKSLAGCNVILSADTTFLAELRGKDKGKAGTLEALLLPHSRVAVTDDGEVVFDLHVCFIDPYDELDKPQVLYIRTSDEHTHTPDHGEPLQPIALSFAAGKYILVRQDEPLHRTLAEGSFYDAETRELTLVLNDGSEE